MECTLGGRCATTAQAPVLLSCHAERCRCECIDHRKLTFRLHAICRAVRLPLKPGLAPQLLQLSIDRIAATASLRAQCPCCMRKVAKH